MTSKLKRTKLPHVVAHYSNASTQEAEAGGLLFETSLNSRVRLCLKNKIKKAGKNAQRLRALKIHAEDPGLVSSTHVAAQRQLLTPVPGVLRSCFSLCGYCIRRVYLHETKTFIHIK